jgi:hypothetical protein
MSVLSTFIVRVGYKIGVSVCASHCTSLVIFAKIEAKKAVLLSWATMKLHTCTVKTYDNFRVKKVLIKFMYYVTDYSTYSAVFASWYCTTSYTLV